MIKEIALKIIELLQADPDLGFDWFFEPPVRAPRFPYGWVDFVGGEVEQHTAEEDLHRWRFRVVIVNRKRADTDETEKAVMDYTEKAVSILKSHRRLDGLVEDLAVERIEGDYARTGEGNLIGTAVTLLVKTWL